MNESRKEELEDLPACYGSGYDPSCAACELCPYRDACEEFYEDFTDEIEEGREDEFIPEEWDDMIMVKETEER